MSRGLQVVERPPLWTPPQAKVEIHNKFHLELFKAKTGKKLTEAWAENVVTNAGRTKCADNGNFPITTFMGGLFVGSGSGAPAPTDTTMGSNLKAMANVASTSQVANAVGWSTTVGDWWRRHKFYFSELVANYSLTEVGLGAQYSSGGRGTNFNTTTWLDAANNPLATRALFRDANGDPISVTKTNTQVMVITATVYLTRGGVDSNMRLLDNFFARNVDYTGVDQVTNNNFTSLDWSLGDGTATPANADVNLSGTQLARRSDPTSTAYNSRNRVYWTSSGWFYPVSGSRPGEKPYVSAYSQDWDLNEGNVTFSEVLCRALTNPGSTGTGTTSWIKLVFPCGTITGTSVTKTNTQKMRQYLEILW